MCWNNLRRKLSVKITKSISPIYNFISILILFMVCIHRHQMVAKPSAGIMFYFF